MILLVVTVRVSTHSRAEAAADATEEATQKAKVSTHSRAEAAAQKTARIFFLLGQFQHTAARRRLRAIHSAIFVCHRVSTHSRAEAAAS